MNENTDHKQANKLDKRAAALRDNLKRRKVKIKSKKEQAKDVETTNTK